MAVTEDDIRGQKNALVDAIRALKNQNNQRASEDFTNNMVSAMSDVMGPVTSQIIDMSSFLGAKLENINATLMKLVDITWKPKPAPDKKTKPPKATFTPTEVHPAGQLDSSILGVLLDIKYLMIGDRDRNSLMNRENAKEKRPEEKGPRRIGDYAETALGGVGFLLILWSMFSLWWGKMRNALSPFLEKTLEVLQSVIPFLTTMTIGVKTVFGGISLAFGAIMKGLDMIARPVAAGIRSVANIMGAAGGAIKALLGVGGLLAIPMKFFSKVLVPIQWILAAFDAMLGIFDGLSKSVEAQLGIMDTLVVSLMSGVGKVVAGMFAGFDDILGWIWEALVPDFGLKTQIADFAKGMWDALMGAVGGALKWMVNAMWLPDEIKKWFNESIDATLGLNKTTTPANSTKALPKAAEPKRPQSAMTDATKATTLAAKTPPPRASNTVVVSAPSQTHNNITTSVSSRHVKAQPPNPRDEMAGRMLSY